MSDAPTQMQGSITIRQAILHRIEPLVGLGLVFDEEDGRRREASPFSRSIGKLLDGESIEHFPGKILRFGIQPVTSQLNREVVHLV